MRFLELFGYDRHGVVKEIPTTLNKGTLTTKEITLAALGFNAPAWVTASSMSILYSISGHAAPLAILIAYFFPMLMLALGLILLTREAPSAAGIFTFTERFLHSRVGTILGWTYTLACAAVAPMTAVIGAQYLQVLIPGLHGEVMAEIIGTVMLVVFCIVSCRGVELTAKVAGIFLTFEIAVVAGLGILGIINPQVHNLSIADMYSLKEAGGVAGIGPGVLFGVWMLANFDSSINYIEEARVPVRTVQRSMLLVLTSAFVIYTLAAIGWQYAIPVDTLAKIVESGDGGPIAAVAKVYLPSSMLWLAIFVVVTSAIAGLQISMNSGARTLYRMSCEGHLPAIFSKVNARKVPWLSTVTLTAVGVLLVWYKPLSKITWYYDVVTITLVFSYIAALASFVRLIFKIRSRKVACILMCPAVLAIAVLLYIAYTAGATPVDPSDLYNAWYIGGAVIISGLLISLSRSHQAVKLHTEMS
ncbi:APC family permease [Crenobacter sp. SG2303]|uniref:APC family permease n=1 Tax=Crenobacter oryzisoli TaxID=3056844 RepID=A0ABT7XU99_9NEIS|nr:APC family permease [Crenobacter sp. SG2303]MDN0076326.1 APC family permease [Crenobacter sp. SG2303]MDN0077347.1 APC family permease [Crenobacter sp. SG2303]